MKNVEAELSALKSQSSALEEAYKKADKVLEDAIATATNDAKGYADVQAAEAQKAAIASAQKLVDNAVAKLEASLDAANKKIDENGNNIASLIAANVTLTRVYRLLRSVPTRLTRSPRPLRSWPTLPRLLPRLLRLLPTKLRVVQMLPMRLLLPMPS